MMTFLHGNELNEVIKALVRQEGSVDLAVAYWGANALETLCIQGNKPIRILCDLMSAGCNPNEIQRMLEHPYAPQVEVRHVPRLHSKVYISGHSLIVGSANASTNGLGDQLLSNVEAALSTKDPTTIADAKAWFNEIWSDETKSQKVTLDLIAQSKRIRRTARYTTFLEELVSNPGYFGKNVTMVYIDESASAKAINAFNGIAARHYSEEQQRSWTPDTLPFYWTGYSKAEVDEDIKPGNYIVNCAYSDAIVQSVKEPGTIPIAENDSILLMNEPGKTILGVPFPQKQRRMLYRAVQHLLEPAKHDAAEFEKIKEDFCHSLDHPNLKLRKLIEAELAKDARKSNKLKR